MLVTLARRAGLVLLAASTVLLTVAGPGAASGPAAAESSDEPRMMVSADGLLWQARLDSGLFADGLPLVPGGRTSGTFWVKNTTAEPAMLGARLVDVTASSDAFAREVAVTASASTGAAARTAAVPGGDSASPEPVTLASPACTALLPAMSLPAGEEAPITVTIRLAESAATGTAEQSIGVTVLVTLTGLGGGEDADACGTGGGVVVGGDPAGSGSTGDGADGGVTGESAGSVPAAGTSVQETPVSGTGTGAGLEAGVRALLGRTAGTASDTAGAGATGLGSGLPSDGTGRFVSVPLPDEWLPAVVGAVALLGGVYVALGRRRRSDAEADEHDRPPLARAARP
ncbi:hypothetical protein [Frigoribacterium faeni]|uniref:Uncharacterized protein n=1 Tax=Frigoribacterium faeni TaxID=145483 RepID=A0ABQ0UJZ3_9MICO|nr:hypothetical protein [Frigoribacterium faeni]BFF13542.1 hypothetical protein GCM10025699_48450 [Microbacterium flavescens]GEK81823.1 hypothetical protein FFA01_01320 [Frigoribacterium faeni]